MKKLVKKIFICILAWFMNYAGRVMSCAFLSLAVIYTILHSLIKPFFMIVVNSVKRFDKLMLTIFNLCDKFSELD